MSFLTFDSYYNNPENVNHAPLPVPVMPGRTPRSSSQACHQQKSRHLKPLMPATRTRPIPQMNLELYSNAASKADKVAKQMSNLQVRPSTEHQRVGLNGGKRALPPTHRPDLAPPAPRVISLAKEKLRQSIKERLAARLCKEHMGASVIMGIPAPLQHLPISKEQEKAILELARNDFEAQRPDRPRRRRKNSKSSSAQTDAKVWDLDIDTWMESCMPATIDNIVAPPTDGYLASLNEVHPPAVWNPNQMLYTNDECGPNHWEESSPSAVSMNSHQGFPQEEWDSYFADPVRSNSKQKDMSEKEFNDFFLNPTVAGGNYILSTIPPDSSDMQSLHSQTGLWSY